MLHIHPESEYRTDTASMLIMAWAHARFSGDTTLLDNYVSLAPPLCAHFLSGKHQYDLFRKWGDYLLSQNTVAPNGFQDTDGLDSTNMTNLALKGILGVSAMGNIAASTSKGSDSDRDKYNVSLCLILAL